MDITIDKDLDWNKQIEKLSSTLCTYKNNPIIILYLFKSISKIDFNTLTIICTGNGGTDIHLGHLQSEYRSHRSVKLNSLII